MSFFYFWYWSSFIIRQFLSFKGNFLVVFFLWNCLQVFLIFFCWNRCTDRLRLIFTFYKILEFRLHFGFLRLAFRSTISSNNLLTYFFFAFVSNRMTLLGIIIANRKSFLFGESRKYLINSKLQHIFHHSWNILLEHLTWFL